MAQEVSGSGPQGSQTPQVPQEVMDRIGMRFNLIDLTFVQLHLMLSGCLTPPEVSMLDTWHRWASDYLDKNEIDKAIEITKKIVDFLEKREKLCERLMSKSRKHGKRYSRHSSGH
jgi:hypothetical protein